MRSRPVAGLFFALLLVSPLARAAAVSISQPLNPGWSTGFCSPCKISSITTRYFGSFSVQRATTLSEASFAVSENALIGFASSFSVSIWSAPIDGELLYETFFDPGEYTRVGLTGKTPGRGFLEMLLPDWFLRPGDYWISLFAPDRAISWGSDNTLGDDVGYALRNGVWGVTRDNVQLGFLLEGKAGRENQSWNSEQAGSQRPEDLPGLADGRQGMALRDGAAAVPIGGTLPLLLGGLLGLAFVRRRVPVV